MIKNSLQLINAPLIPGYIESSRSGAYPPINLLSLATYLYEKKSYYSVEILDGEILSFDEIKNKLYGEYVGFSTNILNYSGTLELASVAKERGCKVIFGGHYSSALAETILQNRKFVDYIIIGDGEEALFSLLQSDDLTRISNLVYRKSELIIRNSEKKLSLNSLPSLDFSLVKLPEYFSNYQKKYPKKQFQKPLAIYSSKGCLWRSKSGGCIYCGIMHDGWRVKNADLVWKEISRYIKLYGSDFFWDVSDTITSNKKWLKEFAQSKPSNINPKFHLYARADQIDEEICEYLKSINCYEVFIGAESGDDSCLQLSNKGFNSEQNIKAIEILTHSGIKIVLSIMIGLPGESADSCEKTWVMMNKILEIISIEEAFINILLPIPGCKSFDMLLSNPGLNKKYINTDLFDLEELRKDWLDNFCEIDYKTAEYYRDKFLTLFLIGASFGKPSEKKIEEASSITRT